MRCYCSEISSLQSDIDKLNSIKGYMSNLTAANDTLSNSLQKLGNVTSSTISPVNIGDITAAQNKLNQDISTKISNIDSTCASMISRLLEDKAYYQQEDDAYHAYIAEQERLRRQRELEEQNKPHSHY